MAYGKAGFLVHGLQLLALAATHKLSSQKRQMISLQNLLMLMRNIGETHPEGTEADIDQVTAAVCSC